MPQASQRKSPISTLDDTVDLEGVIVVGVNAASFGGDVHAEALGAYDCANVTGKAVTVAMHLNVGLMHVTMTAHMTNATE